MAAEEAKIVEVDKQGFLEVKDPNSAKKAKKWKATWFILLSGSLFTYKSPLDAAPTSTYVLKDGKVITTDADGGKGKGKKGKTEKKGYFQLQLKALDKPLEFACVNLDDRDSWVAMLTEGTKKEAVEAPSKEQSKRKRGSLMFRAKKSMGSKAATSGAGKGMMRRLADDDTRALLAALKKTIGKHISEKRATEIEDSIIKIAVKSYFLVDNKSLPSDAFLAVDGPLRATFELLGKIYDRMHRCTDDTLMDAFQRVEKHLEEAGKVLENLLIAHVTPKSINRLKDIFTCLGSAKFLFAIFKDNELEDEVHDLVKAMESYTMFEYYPEEGKKD
jgi:Domain of unknown function (DUF758)/PH domain